MLCAVERSEPGQTPPAAAALPTVRSSHIPDRIAHETRHQLTIVARIDLIGTVVILRVVVKVYGTMKFFNEFGDLWELFSGLRVLLEMHMLYSILYIALLFLYSHILIFSYSHGLIIS